MRSENPASLPEIFTYFDESAFEIPWKKGHGSGRAKYVYAVGAVAIEGQEAKNSLLETLADLREECANDPSLRNHEERTRLLSSGWHLNEDQISTSASLWKFMGHAADIKHHYRFISTHEKVEGDKISRVYAILHATIVRDLLRRYREYPSVEFNFEEFTDLNAKFASLIEFCTAPLREYRSKPPSVNVLNKGDSDLLSVADYMILGHSRLIAENEMACESDPSCGGQCRAGLFDSQGTSLGHITSKSFHFRNYENIRDSLSSAYQIRLHTGVLSG